ncbi:MAG: aldo/keto reductase [Hyphomicrobiales bacterium]
MTASRFAFGGSALAGLYEPVTDEQCHAVLDAVWNAGIREFDTAPHYGNGASERRLGDYLRSRDGWTLTTKVGRLLSQLRHDDVAEGFASGLPFSQRFDYSHDGVLRSVEDSFQRLGLNRIDALYAHDIGDRGNGTNAEHHINAFLNGGAEALSRLKAEGVVSEIGLGVNSVETCLSLIGRIEIDRILIAGRLTPLDPSAAEELVPLCAEQGIRLIVGGVFNSGILATGPGPNARYDYLPASDEIQRRSMKIKQICDVHGVPLAAMALQFPLRFGSVDKVLIGTSKASSLARNLAQAVMPLPDTIWDELARTGYGATE